MPLYKGLNAPGSNPSSALAERLKQAEAERDRSAQAGNDLSHELDRWRQAHPGSPDDPTVVERINERNQRTGALIALVADLKAVLAAGPGSTTGPRVATMAELAERHRRSLAYANQPDPSMASAILRAVGEGFSAEGKGLVDYGNLLASPFTKLASGELTYVQDQAYAMPGNVARNLPKGKLQSALENVGPYAKTARAKRSAKSSIGQASISESLATDARDDVDNHPDAIVSGYTTAAGVPTSIVNTIMTGQSPLDFYKENPGAIPLDLAMALMHVPGVAAGVHAATFGLVAKGLSKASSAAIDAAIAKNPAAAEALLNNSRTAIPIRRALQDAYARLKEGTLDATKAVHHIDTPTLPGKISGFWNRYPADAHAGGTYRYREINEQVNATGRPTHGLAQLDENGQPEQATARTQGETNLNGATETGNSGNGRKKDNFKNQYGAHNAYLRDGEGSDDSGSEGVEDNIESYYSEVNEYGQVVAGDAAFNLILREVNDHVVGFHMPYVSAAARVEEALQIAVDSLHDEGPPDEFTLALERLLASVRVSRSENGTLTVIRRGADEFTVRHEGIHQGQSAVTSDPTLYNHLDPTKKKAIKYLDYYLTMKAARALTKANPKYIGHDIEEVPAWIASGDHEVLGLTTVEAVRVMRRYYAALVEEYGSAGANRVFHTATDGIKEGVGAGPATVPFNRRIYTTDEITGNDQLGRVVRHNHWSIGSGSDDGPIAGIAVTPLTNGPPPASLHMVPPSPPTPVGPTRSPSVVAGLRAMRNEAL